MTAAACRVLIVDDDPLVAIALARLLATRGYVAATITRYGALPSVVDADVLLVDAGCIPQEVRRLPTDLPTVLMSGMDPVDLAVLGVELKATAILKKPVDLTDLETVLQQALRDRN